MIGCPACAGVLRSRGCTTWSGAEFRLCEERLASDVLPALVDRLEAITIRIKDVGGVVSRIVIEARTRRTVIGGARCYCGVVEGVHLAFASRDEADMGRPCIGVAFPQPKVERPLEPKPLRSGCPSGPSLPS
jgi:hypothetical protein